MKAKNDRYVPPASRNVTESCDCPHRLCSRIVQPKQNSIALAKDAMQNLPIRMDNFVDCFMPAILSVDQVRRKNFQARSLP
jgi:hypothetical protein